MRDVIREELVAVERERGVRVLYALESGSRSWGFASKDSDFDVRFVYVRKPADYLRIEGVRDTIEWRLDETLDVVGWDVTKFLSLMRKSNPTVFEWLSSTIVYREDPSFASVREVAPSCFDPVPHAHHYLGIAAKNDVRQLRDGLITLKRYLYAIRSLLAARWVMEKKSPVPMAFDELCAETLEPEMVPVVTDLVERKAHGTEREGIGSLHVVDEWCERTFSELDGRLAAMKPKPAVSWDVLDDVFFGLVGLEGAGCVRAKG